MTLIIDGHPFHYEMENLCRLFCPQEKIVVLENAEEPKEDGLCVYTGLKKCDDGSFLLTVRLVIGDSSKGKAALLPAGAQEEEQKLRMSVTLWKLFSEQFGFRPSWGILTGIRPVKLFGKFAAERGTEEAVKYFQEEFLVSKEKTELARTTWKNEEKILSLARPDGFSLYISIPFCPTRCAYCSFVSSSVEKTFHLIPKYVELLCEEIRRTAQVANRLRLRLQTVYFGGGTPTALSADQLAALISAVRESFDLSDCREFTVEAGRPDTITPDKLDAMKRGGVSRISINPQTLNDEVLQAIGRKHSAAQTLSAFALAREHGFNNINMDLIAGLPKDTPESFRSTMERVLELSPESITVHTLALKRAARLNQEGKSGNADAAEQMLTFAYDALMQTGYRPYYLYRQSRMVGNLENTGWAKPGFENLYNVFIMEECQSILACGAGAVTKLRDPDTDRIERVFNFKYPYEYIDRYEEILGRKERVIEFYERTDPKKDR
jgi:oxygen-independent coproporphyrinogen III oxidase